MVRLGVNIDHIASIRNLRRGDCPDPVDAAKIIEDAGGDGITVHLREDRRHINEKDIERLKAKIKTKLNLEMSIAHDIVEFACKLVPHNVCLVPEKRRELTTEGGLDVVSNSKNIANAVKKLKNKNIIVSIFVDPDDNQVKRAKEIGADFVEIHTGRYAESKKHRVNSPASKCGINSELKKIIDVSGYVLRLGMGLNAGHGLNYENVRNIAKITGMQELNIGYSIICRAVFVGLFNAVKEMKELLNKGSERK